MEEMDNCLTCILYLQYLSSPDTLKLPNEALTKTKFFLDNLSPSGYLQSSPFQLTFTAFMSGSEK